MRFDRIAANADDRRLLLLELGVQIGKLRALVGSTRCVVFRIKPQHQVALAEKIVRRYTIPLIIEQRQLRQLITFS